MEKLLPRLRFPGFEGEWEENIIRDIITRSSDSFNPLKDKSSVRSIELEHLSSDSGELLGFNEGESLGSVKNKFKKDDILFGKLRPYLRKYLKAPFEGVCSSEIWVLRGKKITNDFLYSVVQTETFMDLVNVSSGSKMPRSDWSIVSRGIFSIPIDEEQIKIANVFTGISTKIISLKKKKALLEKYKKGMMQKIFNQEVRFKDEDGGDFSSAPFGHAPSGGDWEENMLGSLGKFLGGGTPSKIDESNYSGSIPWISSSDLFDNDIRKISISRYITSDAVSKSATKLIPADSVLIVSRVSVGKVAVNKVEVCTSQDFTNFIPTSCSSYFIAYLLSYKTNELLSFMQGTSIKGFVKSDLEDMKVQFPTIKEQTKISNFFSAIDDKIDLVAKEIEKMEIWKKGLLGEMFV